MRTKVTLVLVFLNLALFFFIFKFERNWRTERAAQETRRLVLGAEAGDIRTLEITGASPATTIRLERRGENWFLVKPIEWPANPNAVLGIISDLVHLEHQASFGVAEVKANNQSLADYGLDQPKLKVAFSSGDPTANNPLTELAIGDTTIGKMLYVLSPKRDRVHVVPRALAETLALPLEQLRSDAILGIPVFAARSLSIKTAASSGVSVRVRREGARWSFESPIRARASAPDTEQTISDLNALRVKSFVTVPPPTLPSAAPALRVTLEGNNRFETLLIGAPVSATPPVDGNVEYYAQLQKPDSQFSAVFTVVIPTAPANAAAPAPLFDRLRNAQEDLRDRHVLDFDPRAVTAITLAAPNQPGQPELTLQRLDTVAGSPADPKPDAPANDPAAKTDALAREAWQIARHNSGSGTPTLPADRALVQRLLEKLAQLSAKRFQSDAPTAAETENWGFNRQERKVTLALGTAAPATLELGLDAKSEPFARASDAPYIYAIDPDILRDTPTTVLAWRDRLLRELPTAARFTALKITDLASNSALLDVTFEADGTTKSPVAQLKSVQALLPRLRTLRAQSFLQERFPDKINFAGEDRSWRYELVATIALPGGNGAEQTETRSLKFTERIGGSQQLAGSADLGLVFFVEQSLLDPLWDLTNAPHDPGPQPAK